MTIAPDSLDGNWGLLQSHSMASAVKRFADNSHNRSYSTLFESGERLMPEGDSATWDEVSMGRGIAPLEGPDAPSRSRALASRVARSAVMVDIKEHFDLSARFLHLIRDHGSDNATVENKVTMELERSAIRIANTKEYMAAQALINGSVDLSSVPNSQLQGTLTYPIATGSASSSWATASTTIRSTEIPTLRDNFVKLSGVQAGRVIASKSVEGYLTSNTEIKDYAVESLGGQILQNSFIEGTGIELGGMRWKFQHGHYALDATPNSTQDYQTVSAAGDADKIVVLPGMDMDRQVFAVAEGRVWVPAGPVFGDAAGSAGMLREARGFYAYAELVPNPIGIRIHVGWKGLYILKMPNAALAFDTTP